MHAFPLFPLVPTSLLAVGKGRAARRFFDGARRHGAYGPSVTSCRVWRDSGGYEIRSVLRVLFHADFFKRARFAKIKSPADVVAGTVRLAGGHRFPEVDDIQLALHTGYMGQQLLDPPSVEGWHTGEEWVNTSTLMHRINFAARQFADLDQPGIQAIIARIRALGSSLTPEQTVDACLDLMGPLSVADETREELIAHLASGGDLRFGADAEANPAVAQRIGELLQLIAATREYQMA